VQKRRNKVSKCNEILKGAEPIVRLIDIKRVKFPIGFESRYNHNTVLQLIFFFMK